MNGIVDRVADQLYPTSGPTTLDIKFYSGGTSNVSAEFLAEQVLRSQSQIDNDTAVLVENVDRDLI